MEQLGLCGACCWDAASSRAMQARYARAAASDPADGKLLACTMLLAGSASAGGCFAELL